MFIEMNFCRHNSSVTHAIAFSGMVASPRRTRDSDNLLEPWQIARTSWNRSVVVVNCMMCQKAFAVYEWNRRSEDV